jgi:hypothetical protein
MPRVLGWAGRRAGVVSRRGLLLCVCVVASGLVLAGCDDPVRPQPPVRHEPGLRVASGAGHADTIGAFLPGDLVITVAGPDGAPLPGREVRVTPIATGDGVPTMLAIRLKHPLTFADAHATAVDTTDAAGTVRLRLRLGQHAGPAALVVRSAGMMDDTARFLVEPGRPARLAVQPRDTAVLVGGSYALGGAVADRMGHALPGTVTLRHLDGPAALAADGRVSGTAVGRARFLAEGGGFTDTAWVSVVPNGVLAAFAATLQPGETGRIVTFRTDGSQFRVAAERVIPYIGPTSYGLWPAWSPSGDRMAFLDGTSLLVLDLATGTTHDITPADTPPVAGEYPPEFDRTGAWIYFTRGYLGGQNTIWRVRADGTGAAQVSPDAEWGLEQRGSPSPDGTRIVYHTNRTTSGVVVRVLDLATGDSTDLAPGRFPRWSPDGQWIGYGGPDGLRVIRPDGTGDRSLGVGGFEPGFDWGPDGEWIVMDTWWQFASRLELVHVPSGLRLPLPFTRNVRMGTWRR